MGGERIILVLLLLLQTQLAQPKCSICNATCSSPHLIQLNNTTVSCESTTSLTTLLDWATGEKAKNSVNASFDHLTKLNLSNNGLSDYSGNSSSLLQLDLSNNSIGQLSELNFPKLVYLNVNGNSVKDIGHLKFSLLERLHASNNKLSKLRIGSCPQLKLLDLSNNAIHFIDKNVSKSVPKLEILNLSSNALSQLNDSAFNISSLLKLDLNSNNIFHLSPKCFSGLTKLQVLDISNNKIVAVFPSTLQYFPGLISLVLSDNPELSTQDFGIASRRLKSLNASRANLKKIPSSLTRSVRYLSLSSNNITQIQCGDFDSYPLLHSLDLTKNNITVIEEDALGRLEMLKILDLSQNSLSSVPVALPSNLKILLLSGNRFEKLASQDLIGLSQLRHLDLSKNLITTLAEGWLGQLYALEMLNLSANPLKTVSVGALTGPHGLRVLDMSFLENVTQCGTVLCFPVPEPNKLEQVTLSGSPVLVDRLLNDAAALKTFKQLRMLNLSQSNLSDVRPDLTTYFPRLHFLILEENHLNCTELSIDAVSRVNCSYVVVDESATTRYAGVTTSAPQSTETLDFSMKNDIYPELNTSDVAYLWSESKMGEVDAFSAEIGPPSHPGLFVLLLLPVALFLAVLFYNYSRLKRKTVIERRQVDIEIPNISSELW